MKKLLLAAAVATALSTPVAALAQTPAAAPASPHTFTGNLGFANDYRFRSISQTFGKMAVQGGFDYSHSSGFYLGTWASNVYGGNNASGLGTNYFNGNIEWDVYGGYKFEPIKDITMDVGVLTYMYPGAKYGTPTRGDYTNTELYLGASWKWFTAKYSNSLTDYFGINNGSMSPGGVAACGVDAGGGALAAGSADCAKLNAGGSKGSSYLDLGATFDIGSGFNLVAHIGKLSVKNYGLFNYTDYKLGLTKDWLGLTWGASYIANNARSTVYRTVKTEGAAPTTNTVVYDTRKPTLLFTVQKTF